MGKRYLLDSNTVIDYIAGLHPSHAIKWLNQLIDEEIIVNKTIHIRQKQKIKLPDAIIASTALANGLVLISRNTKDFTNIPGLEVVNPYDITSNVK